ncbi:hypothetical protein PM082_015559 [Marasmius tenuissimus]|nr:hypothetical protein PM082_015559 [Marasmius tenuissimus]
MYNHVSSAQLEFLSNCLMRPRFSWRQRPPYGIAILSCIRAVGPETQIHLIPQWRANIDFTAKPQPASICMHSSTGNRRGNNMAKAELRFGGARITVFRSSHPVGRFSRTSDQKLCHPSLTYPSIVHWGLLPDGVDFSLSLKSRGVNHPTVD